MSNLLSAKQVASRMNVSVKFIYDLARNGQLPSVRLGRSKGLRFREDGVEEFIRCRIQKTKIAK